MRPASSTAAARPRTTPRSRARAGVPSTGASAPCCAASPPAGYRRAFSRAGRRAPRTRYGSARRRRRPDRPPSRARPTAPRAPAHSERARRRPGAPTAGSRARAGRARRARHRRRRSSAPRPTPAGRAPGSGDPRRRPRPRRRGAGTRDSGAGRSRRHLHRRAYPTAPGGPPHERRRSLRLPRLPRAARAPRLRGARRARAGRTARARARGERLLPHGRRPHAPLGADGDVSERFRPVGRQRGARCATGRAAVGRRSLPVRLDGARARGAGLDHRRSPAAPLRRPPAEPGPAVPVLPDASRGRPDRAPGADAPRVPRRPRRGGRERALLPHHRRALSRGAWAERFRRVGRPHARRPTSWRSASRTSIPASGASSASATATSEC